MNKITKRDWIEGILFILVGISIIIGIAVLHTITEVSRDASRIEIIRK